MADKYHSGRWIKDKQRMLEEGQRKVLGMSTGSVSHYNQCAIVFEDAKEPVMFQTIEQIGGINTQLRALDKRSKVRNEYEQFLLTNQSFLNQIQTAVK